MLKGFIAFYLLIMGFVVVGIGGWAILLPWALTQETILLAAIMGSVIGLQLILAYKILRIISINYSAQ